MNLSVSSTVLERVTDSDRVQVVQLSTELCVYLCNVNRLCLPHYSVSMNIICHNSLNVFSVHIRNYMRPHTHTHTRTHTHTHTHTHTQDVLSCYGVHTSEFKQTHSACDQTLGKFPLPHPRGPIRGCGSIEL